MRQWPRFENMGLWLKILERCESCAGSIRSGWYRRKFLALEKPRHRLVELGEGVVFNVPVRGGQGTLRIGTNVMLGYAKAHRLGSGEIMLQARLPDAQISIGTSTVFNNNTVVCAMESITIGERCLIGDSCAIYDSDFHDADPAKRHTDAGPSLPVVIGNNVVFGSRVVVLKGVTIGDNSVIGAMSLVTKDIPANCIAAGIPAKVIKQIE